MLRAALLLLLLSSPALAQDTVSPALPLSATPQPVETKPDAALAEKPLPDLPSLIARAKAHQEANDAIAKNYTYKLTGIADEFDNKGTKKGTHTDEYQVFFVKDWTIRQHIAHDGKPLSDSQAKKVQEEVDKDVKEIKEGTKKESKGGIKLGVTQLMKVATFSNARREIINGRPTIVFDYKGDPKAKTEDIGQVVMQRLSGSVWIDEQDAAVQHLTGHLDENYRYGGFLVNIKKGSWFDIQTTRINDEIWFPKSLDAHVDGKILLFKGFDSDIHTRSSDYRKMTTSITLLPGSRPIDENGNPLPDNADPTAPPITPTPATPAPKPLQ